MKKMRNKNYRCDYCGKQLSIKNFMSQHERICIHNPNNDHICLKSCKHLYDYNEEQKKVFFYCNKLKKRVHTYEIERFPKTFNKIFTNEVRMPLSCKHYKRKNALSKIAMKLKEMIFETGHDPKPETL